MPTVVTATPQLRFAWFRVAIALLLGALTTFAIGGYQALQPVMVKEGAYNYLCGPADRASKHECSSQRLRLDLMFTLAVSVTNHCSLPVGLFTARHGPRASAALGGVIMASGGVLFALSTNAFAAWIPGYIIIGVGGAFLAFSLFTVPSLVAPRHAGTVMSLLVGSFDASAITMTGWSLLYDAGLSLRSVVLLWVAVLVVLFAVALTGFVYPAAAAAPKPSGGGSDSCAGRADAKHADTPSGVQQPEVPDADCEQPTAAAAADGSPAGGSSTGSCSASEAGGTDASALPTPYFPDDPGWWNTVRSWPFAVTTIWLCTYFVSKYFFMTTINDQALWITHGNTALADTASKWFSIMLPASAVTAPVTGLIIDRFGIATAVLVMAGVSAALGVTSALSVYEVEYVTMVLVVFNRLFLFSCGPLIFSRMYGPRGMSAMYGTALFVAAGVNYSNYLWTFVAEKVLHTYLPLNLACNCLCVVVGLVMAGQLRTWERLRLAPERRALVQHGAAA